jgi:hypothetical protein
VLSCYVSLRSEFPVIIFPHKYCVRFVFISSCLLEGLCFIILFVLFAHIDIVLCFCFVFIRCPSVIVKLKLVSIGNGQDGRLCPSGIVKTDVCVHL